MNSHLVPAPRKNRPEPASTLVAPVHRDALLAGLVTPRFDLVIIGGGIHGAALLRAAAMNGLRTVLLERGDFGGETSSRLSNIAHGGLRYLKMFDFAQVFEGIRSREELFEAAPHTVHPQWFDIPIRRGDWWLRLQLSIGLPAYDLLATDPERRHRWLPRNRMDPELLGFLGKPHVGSYRYCDGLMKSDRLVLENLLSARAFGGITLNYVEVTGVEPGEDGPAVRWRDIGSDRGGAIRARVVVNCAGPWVNRIPGAESRGGIRFSQGTHLVFDRPWRHSALYLPLPGGRSYFVLPHAAGTVVGTTERELSEPHFDPTALPGEGEEILSRLRTDLPGSPLTRRNLVSVYAGIRTLPVRGNASHTSQLSRKHEWANDVSGVLTLRGGKYTTAVPTAYEGLCRVFSLLGRSDAPMPVGGYTYPGSQDLREQVARFAHQCAVNGVPTEVVRGATERLGALVRYLPELDPEFRCLSGTVLDSEVLYYLRYEQAETLSDLLRRRLRIDLRPGHGMNLVPGCATLLRRERPGVAIDRQVQEYGEYIARMVRSVS